MISKSSLESEIFQLEWNKANGVPVHKKMTNNLRFHFFRYVEKYLNVCYITRCRIFSQQMTLFPRISQACNLETLVSISSYQLPM